VVQQLRGFLVNCDCIRTTKLTCYRSWHSYKFIDPAESGAVLPILHLNGFKISERTIYGCMDDRELVSLFTGFGYQVRMVANLDEIDADLHCSMVWALGEIRKIQYAARSGNPIIKPRWPLIIIRTPKVCISRQEIITARLLTYAHRDGLDQKRSMEK